MQLARSREARFFGAAFGSRSGGCHAARLTGLASFFIRSEDRIVQKKIQSYIEGFVEELRG